MLRTIAPMIVGIGFLFVSVATAAQDASPEATIAALEMRVAELEQQLGLTPTTEPAQAGTPNVATSQDYVAGTALDLLAAGEPRAISVIAVGPYIDNELPVVVRNNSGETVQRVTVAATARTADGSLLASGEDRNLLPYRVMPAGVAFGYIDFGGVELPVDASFEFTVQGAPAQDLSDAGILDYQVTSVSSIDGRFVGEVVNGHDRALSSSSLSLICFAEDGTLIDSHYASLNPDLVEPGQTSSFQVLLDEGETCPRFLAAAWGFVF